MARSDWMTAEETTQYLGIGKSKLYELAQEGKIPRHKVGKKWKFHRDEVNAWVRATQSVEEFFIESEYDIEDNDELRDPQQDAHAATIAHFESSDEAAILQLPVGCGKSGVIALLPFGLAEGRVLVIAPNVTIREGLRKQLDITSRQHCFWRKRSVLKREAMFAGPHMAILDGVDANIHDCRKSHIVLTNIQQLASSADRWLPAFDDDFFDLILVDEGHHSAAKSWQKVFERFPNAKVVNLTATPYRADDKELAGELVYRYSFKRAMVKGYIKSLQVVYTAPKQVRFTYEGEKKTLSLDEVLQLKEEDWFSRGIAMAPECNRNIVDASIDRLEKLRETGTNHQLIAVGMQVNHAKAIRSLYAERGYEAGVIHSKLNQAEKDEVLRKLRAGLLDVIVQVQMLGEGFDHPKLSVAAVFRPFRTLSPFLQFIGRIMRVVVQNYPRHPDNYGHVVTHTGMNLDTLLDAFRDLEREDREYLANLLGGEEPEPPVDVREGRAEMKLRPDMVVHEEVVDSLIEEDFIDSDDQLVFDEVRRQAEAMGLDADAMVQAALQSKKPGKRTLVAPGALVPNPQRQRQEAQLRLNEEVKRAARVLLNRVGLRTGGSELRLLYPSLAGTNFPAAIQIFHRRVNKVLGVERGHRGDLDTVDYEKGISLLPDLLDPQVRKVKAKQREAEESKEAATEERRSKKKGRK